MADSPRIVGQRSVLANDRRAIIAGAAEAGLLTTVPAVPRSRREAAGG
jgi:hypothetical protein